jgi:hypothetical protein
LGAGDAASQSHGGGKGVEKSGSGGSRTESAGTTGGSLPPLPEPAEKMLIHMIEEEKLAHDVYARLRDVTGLQIFGTIAAGEATHHSTMLRDADRRNIDVSYLPSEPGEFHDPAFQALYEQLVQEGSASPQAALRVGVKIETLNFTDISDAMLITEDAALDNTYSHLASVSQSHLRQFQMTLQP